MALEDHAAMREARNLRGMGAAQTPLLGDENAEHEDALAIAQERRPDLRSCRRPNPSGRCERTRAVAPAMGEYRVGGTPFDERRAQRAAKQDLLSGLRNLPRPQNDFGLVLDEDDEEEDGDDDDDDNEVLISVSEDAADCDAQQCQAREDDRLRGLARCTQNIEHDLSRPANADLEQVLAAQDSSRDNSAAKRLVLHESVGLIKHDTIAQKEGVHIGMVGLCALVRTGGQPVYSRVAGGPSCGSGLGSRADGRAGWPRRIDAQV